MPGLESMSMSGWTRHDWFQMTVRTSYIFKDLQACTYDAIEQTNTTVFGGNVGRQVGVGGIGALEVGWSVYLPTCFLPACLPACLAS